MVRRISLAPSQSAIRLYLYRGRGFAGSGTWIIFPSAEHRAPRALRGIRAAGDLGVKRDLMPIVIWVTVCFTVIAIGGSPSPEPIPPPPAIWLRPVS